MAVIGVRSCLESPSSGTEWTFEPRYDFLLPGPCPVAQPRAEGHCAAASRGGVAVRVASFGSPLPFSLPASGPCWVSGVGRGAGRRSESQLALLWGPFTQDARGGWPAGLGRARRPVSEGSTSLSRRPRSRGPSLGPSLGGQAARALRTIGASNVRVRRISPEAEPRRPLLVQDGMRPEVTLGGPRLSPRHWKASLHLRGVVPEMAMQVARPGPSSRWHRSRETRGPLTSWVLWAGWRPTLPPDPSEAAWTSPRAGIFHFPGRAQQTGQPWGGAGPGRREGIVWGADPAWAGCPGPTV